MSHRSCFKYLMSSLVAVAFGLILAGCSVKRDIKKTRKSTAETAVLSKLLHNYKADFGWFAGKARVRVETDDLRMGVTMQIRMRKDSLIWIRIEKLGFEVGRALITPDSAYVIDRLSKEYYAEHLSKFIRTYKAPFDFQDLQNVLAGGTVTGEYRTVLAVVREGMRVLQTDGPKYKAEYSFDADDHLRRTYLIDQDERWAELTYGGYAPVEHSQDLSFLRDLEIFDGQSVARFEFRFSQMTFDQPTSMKFEIPSHYAKVE